MFEKISQYKAIIEGFLKIRIKSLKYDFYVSYSNFKSNIVKKLCTELGFDNIFSIHHLAYLNKTGKKMAILDVGLFPYFKAYDLNNKM